MWNSQFEQDKLLETELFKGMKNGIFVDVGAHDGITINNTLFFEKHRNWTGINIEPQPDIFEKLKINRPNCINLNIAISDEDGKSEFIHNTGYTNMLSGLKNSYDDRHYGRNLLELIHYGGESKVITIETKKLSTVFEEHDIKNINYLSIDVEGGEFNVIKSIDFEKCSIQVIGFESNYDDLSVEIVRYLEEKKFVFYRKHKGDIFMLNTQYNSNT